MPNIGELFVCDIDTLPRLDCTFGTEKTISVAHETTCCINIHKLGYLSVVVIINPLFSERELTFMFAMCYRPSVRLSSVVCNVRAPYSDD